MSTDWEDDSDPWTVKSVARVWENAWFAIDTHEVTHPGGAEGEYSVIRPHRLAVGVLPIEPDGSVHLVGQWRFPLKRYSWEMPEGGAEAGETTLDCAQRELEEESGLRAATFTKILEMDLSNSLTDERAVIYLATELSPGAYRPEAVEVLKHKRAPFKEVLARVVGGEIRDSLTVAAMLRAHHMAVTGALPKALAQAILG